MKGVEAGAVGIDVGVKGRGKRLWGGDFGLGKGEGVGRRDEEDDVDDGDDVLDE